MWFVLNLDQMIHVGPEHFKILNWLPVTKRVDQIILCHVFKIKSGTASDYLGEYFSLKARFIDSLLDLGIMIVTQFLRLRDLKRNPLLIKVVCSGIYSRVRICRS